MRHLVDTQIMIWAMISPEKLFPSIKTILQSGEILVSQISFFEIAIKQTIGKLPKLDMPISTLFQRAEQDGFKILPLHAKHIETYVDIPLFAQHRDPFDRLLLATAVSEDIPVLSADENFKLYVPKVRVIMNQHKTKS